MKILLEEPYKSLYGAGYIRHSVDGRKRVDLVNRGADRTTVSYARYLVSVSLGRLLMVDEEVDHINRDKADDRLENLQLLSKEEHRLKNSIEMSTGRTCQEITCAFCSKVFSRELRNTKDRKGYKNSFCSRSCSGKYYKAVH